MKGLCAMHPALTVLITEHELPYDARNYKRIAFAGTNPENI